MPTQIYSTNKVSFFEMKKIKETITALRKHYCKPPYPTFKFFPELYWLELCDEINGQINEEILGKIVSDVSSYLSIKSLIGYKVTYYHHEDEKHPVELPSKSPIYIENGILRIDIYTVSYISENEHYQKRNLYCMTGGNILFGIIAVIIKYYLSECRFDNLSDYFVHVALFYFGFGNYAVAAPFRYYIGNPASPDECILGYDNWSDAGAIRKICNN